MERRKRLIAIAKEGRLHLASIMIILAQIITSHSYSKYLRYPTNEFVIKIAVSCSPQRPDSGMGYWDG